VLHNPIISQPGPSRICHIRDEDPDVLLSVSLNVSSASRLTRVEVMLKIKIRQFFRGEVFEFAFQMKATLQENEGFELYFFIWESVVEVCNF